MNESLITENTVLSYEQLCKHFKIDILRYVLALTIVEARERGVVSALDFDDDELVCSYIDNIDEHKDYFWKVDIPAVYDYHRSHGVTPLWLADFLGYPVNIVLSVLRDNLS